MKEDLLIIILFSGIMRDIKRCKAETDTEK